LPQIDQQTNNKAHAPSEWQKLQIVRVLYKNALGAIIGSAFIIAIATYVLSKIYPTIGLLIWFTLGQILNLTRYYAQHLFTVKPERFTPQVWLQLHRGLTFLSGCMYGVLAVYFFSTEHPLYQLLVILLTCGMGVAGSGTHSADAITYRLFLFASVLPMMARSLWEATEVHYGLTAMMVLLLAVMISAANQSRNILLDNFRMTESLQYRATHDGLVGLLNRYEFEKRFNTFMDSTNHDVITSMIFIDLDNFKILNDSYGHQEGDKALVKIGEIIRHSIRKSDTAARFGGDEFMILIQSDSAEEAKNVANKILDKINEFQHTMKETSSVLGASIGIAFTKGNQTSYESMLRGADQACYQAKSNGKGTICLKGLVSA